MAIGLFLLVLAAVGAVPDVLGTRNPHRPRFGPSHRRATSGFSVARRDSEGDSSGSTWNSLIVLGASYCDNGHERAPEYAKSLKTTPYWGGRWTNGKVWDEYLAEKLGTDANPAPLANFAYGGATIDNAQDPANVPDLGQQIAALQSNLANGSIGKGVVDGRALIAIWIGLNSMSQIWHDAATASSDLSGAKAKASARVQSLISHALSASSVGGFQNSAPDLLVMPLPPAEVLLTNIYTANGDSASLETAKALTDHFNSELSNSIASLQGSLDQAGRGQKVYTFDIPELWRNMVNSPDDYGLTVTNKPCYSEQSGQVCAEPGKYLFFDSLHPTTAVHYLLAGSLADALHGSAMENGDPVAYNEP